MSPLPRRDFFKAAAGGFAALRGLGGNTRPAGTPASGRQDAKLEGVWGSEGARLGGVLGRHGVAPLFTG